MLSHQKPIKTGTPVFFLVVSNWEFLPTEGGALACLSEKLVDDLLILIETSWEVKGYYYPLNASPPIYARI